MGIRQRAADIISPQNTTKDSNGQENKQLTPPNGGKWDRPRSQDAVGVGIPGFDDQRFDQEVTRSYGGDAVFRRIKNSPEIISIMQAVIDDIVGSGVKMRYVGRTDNAQKPGKRSVNDAEKFWKRNKEIIADSIMDAMAMGDGYLYKKQPDKEQARKTVEDYVSKNYDFNFDPYEETAVNYLMAKNEDELSETRDLELVPASTVRHDIDEFGNIEEYVQKIKGEEYQLNPDRVVHHSYLNLNGSTYGFTPVAALFAELDMLANAKDYNGVRFDNAAVPNKVFKLPDDGPDGQNFEMVKQTLQKYRQLENKHRDLVLTGNIEIEDLNDASDMEFRELAEYVTRVLVMAWGVPPSRIGNSLGVQGATESALASEGYNKRIQRMQDKYETILNQEIFEPMFNVRIEFENPDIKAEIRRAERDLRRTEVVKQQIALGLMTREDAVQYLGKTEDQIPDDVEDGDVRAAARELGRSQRSSQEDTNQSSAEQTVNEQMTPNRTGGNDPAVENQ